MGHGLRTLGRVGHTLRIPREGGLRIRAGHGLRTLGRVGHTLRIPKEGGAWITDPREGGGIP